MERIGAINQLAMSHYADQISRYRELSVRLNELEKEKQAIVQFMDEIESKKRKVFMSAFEKINVSLKSYFSKLTGGGEATLKLENPEEPFTGGIDMIVAVSKQTVNRRQWSKRRGTIYFRSRIHFFIKRLHSSLILYS